MKKIRRYVQAWLSLLRLPNLFTIPGDSVCGFLLAGGRVPDKSFLLVVISSLSYYIFGLITNDIRDMEEDGRTNPLRPLPSGEIRPAHAKFAAATAMLCGLAAGFAAGPACGVTGLFLLLLIILYNFVFKTKRLVAPLLPASCRALNVLLGVSFHGLAPGSPATMTLVHFIFIYFIFVFGISVAARNERSSDTAGFLPGAFLIFLSISLLCIILVSRLIFIAGNTGLFPPAFSSALVAMPILAILFARFLRKGLSKGERRIGADIGGLICGMILFQTIFLSANGFYLESWLILSLFPPSIASSMLFKGT